MSSPPYMKLYWGNYHRQTPHLTRSQHGAYFMLLSALWNNDGKLPADDEVLALHALCTPEEWAEMKGVIMPFFDVRRGKVSNSKVTEELSHYKTIIGKRKSAGKAGSKVTNGKRSRNSAANAEHLTAYPEPEPERITVDKSTASLSVLPVDHDQVAWSVAVAILTDRANQSEAEARKFFGRLLSANGLQARDMLPSLTAADVNGTQDPKSYLAKAAQLLATRRAPRATKRVGFV